MTQAIRRILSPARMGTYDAALLAARSKIDALDLYMWNAKTSSALMVPLHVVEVSTRNAVDEALAAVYGPDWPWDAGFEGSLPSPRKGFNPRDDLQRARRGQPSTGKVIPELHFVFWQKLFTARFDHRIWSGQVLHVFPNVPTGALAHDTRRRVHDALEQVRRLRNRIAHHEPIFARDLAADVAAIELLLQYRCCQTSSWVKHHEEVSPLLDSKPL